MDARDLKKVVWGLFLVGLGVVFLLEQTGMIADIGAWWPLVFFVIGFTHLLERRLGGAVVMFLLGGAFLAITWHWNGLDWGNGWPLILVAVGVGIVVKAFTGEESAARKQGGRS